MPHLRSAISQLRRPALPLCVLGFLWFTLINHLRIEWAVNPQYGYGWAVPFLCALLIWKNVRGRGQGAGSAEQGRPDHGITGQQDHGTSDQKDYKTTGPRDNRTSSQWSVVSGQWSVTDHLSPIFHLLFICLALAWLPTRLIQEANPEWRLVSWALAIEVVGLTLFIWELGVGSRKLGDKSVVSGRWSVVSGPSSHLLFPVCFFLIAVPWPTLIEGPLVQFLTHTNAATTVEVVGWFGIPALLRGNIIEVGTGMVGIDDACSGIRSFQATLMISLFLGELFRLAIRRRLMLVVAGCLLAYVFNVARTSVLVWIASGKGVAAMSVWHDPTGVTILVANFICLWLAAMALRRVGFQPASAGGVSAASHNSQATGPKADIRHQTSEGQQDHGTTGQPDHGTTGQRDEWSVVSSQWSVVALRPRRLVRSRGGWHGVLVPFT